VTDIISDSDIAGAYEENTGHAIARLFKNLDPGEMPAVPFSVFLFNRDLANAREAELLWEDAAPSRVLDSFTLTGNDLKAHNGFNAPQNVAPKPFDKPTTSNHRTRLELPARSYTIIQFAV
jgi:alpha-L-arabinofuranosidase